MKKVDGVYIVDTWERFKDYAGMGSHFPKAIDFLRLNTLSTLPTSRYGLDGNHAYAKVQEVCLKEWGTGRPEVHHEFFDIHVPITGPEIIGVGKFDPKTVGEFDVNEDIGFYDGVPLEPLTLKPGEFAILYPKTCAHAPCCAEVGGGVLRKIVVKVRAD